MSERDFSEVCVEAHDPQLCCGLPTVVLSYSEIISDTETRQSVRQ